MNRKVNLLCGFVPVLLLVPWSVAIGDEVSCATCHKVQGREHALSTHQDLSCQECHGGQIGDEITLAQTSKYIAALAAADTSLQFDHGADFLGVPTRRQIPDKCGTCHADVERMNPYGIRTDQLARYWTSQHGKTLAADGDDRVAVCIDCHGTHDVLASTNPASKTHPLNVPATCGYCHADAERMQPFDVAIEIVDEYRRSVHGDLLLGQGDTGAPTCATCHGNHSASPPGFASVSSVCGQCHQHASVNFATSIHAQQNEHKACVQCHGGGEGRHFHLIERITKPAGVLIQRYAHLLASEPNPSPQQITESIHPDPKQIIMRAIPTCMECHDDLEDDESLPILFNLLDEISEAERYYVRTAQRLNEIEQGVLLVDGQRFKLGDAKTHLIELAPLQHTLSNEKVEEKVMELNRVCDEVNAELDELENGLRLRYQALIPIWIFSVVFAIACYAKYKQLHAIHVMPTSIAQSERKA